MFSQTIEYALRAMVWLADHPDTPLTSVQIATATQVPPAYLSKVMQSLGRAGLVTAQRGKHGGFTLTKAADQLTILEVVNAVEPLRRIHSCPLSLAGHRERLCPLHRKMDDALVAMERAFAETRLTDLLQDTVRPLCDLVEVAHA
jgi:Rrf2 family protein